MTPRTAPLIAILLALPAIALAEPATIRVFEAYARAAPSKDAAVVGTFVENAQVSVSEEATGGFRRVRLPDGTTAWIDEQALAFSARAAAAPPAAPPAAAPLAAAAAPGPPDLKPKIYVKDLDHFALLLRDDPAFRGRADALANRRKAAHWIWGVGGAACAGLLVAAISRMEASSGYPPGDPRFMSATPEEKQAAVLGATALVVGLGSAIGGAVVLPKRGDILDVLNDWNVRHPDQQFSITGAAGSEVSR